LADVEDDWLSRRIDAIVINGRDNVAVAVRELEPNSTVRLDAGGKMVCRKVGQRIPAGHKFALASIQKGGDVIKYGEVIGKASAPIQVGYHVHVHNVASQRGRGDLKTKEA
jgi:altronate dehydratase small subunit